MTYQRLQDNLSVRITIESRAALERLCKIENITLGEAARTLIDEGIKARGIA
jgi:hypothetical protein